METIREMGLLPSLDQIQDGYEHLIKNGIQMGKAGSYILIGILVISVLVCLLGLNIRRLWTALASLLIGLCAGYYAGLSFGMDDVISLGIGAAAGIILLILAVVLKTFGNLLLCLLLASYTGILLVPAGSQMSYAICLGVGVIIALVSIKLKDPMTILCTVASGSITAGIAAMQIFSLKEGYYQYIISAVLAVIGLISQIIYASRKVAKQDIKKAREIKAETSVENEVEAMRLMLDEEEPEEADEDMIDDSEEFLEEPAAAEITEEPAAEEYFEEQDEEEFFDEFEEDDLLVETEEDFPEEQEEAQAFDNGEEQDEETDDNSEEDISEGLSEEEPVLSAEEAAIQAQKELEETKKELERIKKELEEAKKKQ